jgi:hypothetical protein
MATGPRNMTDDDATERPRQRPSARVRTVPTVGGLLDAFVEGEAARQVRRGRRPERPDMSAYRGHERISVANLEDDATDEPWLELGP